VDAPVQTEIDPRDLIGHKAVDRNGDKIGTVDEVYLDDATGKPEWAAVRTGLFGRDAFVPLATSDFVSDELRIPYDKSQVKDSPDFGVGQHLSPEQELQLYRYYGLEVPSGGNGSGSGSAKDAASSAATAPAAPPTAPASPVVPPAQPAATQAMPVVTTTTAAAAAAATAPTGSTPTADTSRTAAFMAPPPAQTASVPPTTAVAAGAAGAGAAAAGTSAPTEPAPTLTKTEQRADQLDPLTGPLPGTAADATRAAQAGVPEPIEFVCREERLDISTEWRVLGKARLRKYVTAEQVERRVPVIRERIRVERVPVGAEERAQLTEQEITESTEEVTLHEQRVVVRKAVVPVERIRLVTERFTEEEIVRDELHREHIQVQDSTRPAGPTPVPGTGQPVGETPANQMSPGQAPTAAPSTPPSAPGRPDLPGHAIGA
jgi:stress response protein YsnF/sporulation protein YlmC with PRC-barrel domain